MADTVHDHVSKRPRWSISLDLHRGLEAGLGLSLFLVALLLTLDLAALVPACVAGFGMAALGFAASREGRTVDHRSHYALDVILVVVLLVGALVNVLVGNPLLGTAVLVVAAALLFALVAFTAYDADPVAADGAVAVTNDDGQEGGYSA